ncbi:division/cell wall cluster transcriptional repressor MraZ [Hespellia stercorisuis]|uniref:Transcriptional regulator MraZ n=1 Tax=Hespellia stercorisuis DSM 15480 TaxID=1121950 RepID=A0A1M6ILX8_9FIRM|nr:division/cell wall cluster transcriptional repressor MraZ [Hespellia stercorisuis]SHJ35434.1 MraZ protein [Hespellia stercorisuis DSM 15480]
MLLGEFNHSIDDKGRLIIPAKLREELGESLVICKGLEGCLFVYSQDEWESFVDKLETLPLMNKAARTFKRYFFGSASDSTFDKQGRVLIKPELREAAGLEKDVVLVGVQDHVEIWDKARWEEESDVSEEDMDAIAGQMEAMGIQI